MITGRNTTLCPACDAGEIEAVQEGGADFDEKGWFYRYRYRCRSCGHTWSGVRRLPKNS